MKKGIPGLLCLALLVVACDRDGKAGDVLYSYRAILNEEFRFGTGKIIPVTIESSIDRDGLVTPDGRFLIFSSNRAGGNYDLYLRRISDMAQVRITTHAAAEISPSLSPDGRFLAFVSTREDPEGDIYVGSIDPDSIFEKARKKNVTDLALEAKNITLVTEPATGAVLPRADRNPVWSHDGSAIAFSSTRGGVENIWLVDRSGKKARQLTGQGGMYPCFSAQGDRLLYVSYRFGRGGELTLLNLATGAEETVAAPGAIKLFPVFTADDSAIVYTAIDRDSDGNGEIDLRDASRLYCVKRNDSRAYPLTLSSQSSFSARWYPVYGTDRYRGVLLFTTLDRGIINLCLIPDSGVIPVRGSAQAQLELANRYLKEEDDGERHLAALMSVYHHFGDFADVQSRVYVSRALTAAALYCSREKDPAGYDSALAALRGLSQQGCPYAGMALAYAVAGGAPGQGLGAVDRGIRTMQERGGRDYLPYALEDRADLLSDAGKKAEALKAYTTLLAEYPSFERATSIHRKIVSVAETGLAGALSPSSLIVLEKGQYYQVNEVILKTIALAREHRNTVARTALLRSMLQAQGSGRHARPLILYCLGMTAWEQGDADDARRLAQEALDGARPATLVGYLSNMLMGLIEEHQGRRDRAAEHYFNAMSRYRIEWKDPEIAHRLAGLVSYYEERGRDARSAGAFAEATALYRNYVSLMGHLHRLGKFADLYNLHASRAHALYIDSMRESDARAMEGLELQYRQGLAKARMDFDKAHLFGLSYILCLKALDRESAGQRDPQEPQAGLRALCLDMKESMMHGNWALSIDDTFVDPYILQTWMYQYLDLRREESALIRKEIDRHFPHHLLEKSIPLLEKALAANNEEKDRERKATSTSTWATPTSC
jgi:TolB protein